MKDGERDERWGGRWNMGRKMEDGKRDGMEDREKDGIWRDRWKMVREM